MASDVMCMAKLYDFFCALVVKIFVFRVRRNRFTVIRPSKNNAIGKRYGIKDCVKILPDKVRGRVGFHAYPGFATAIMQCLQSC
jgi:hypothetical protein